MSAKVAWLRCLWCRAFGSGGCYLHRVKPENEVREQLQQLVDEAEVSFRTAKINLRQHYETRDPGEWDV